MCLSLAILLAKDTGAKDLHPRQVDLVFDYSQNHFSYMTNMSIIHAENRKSCAVAAKFDAHFVDMVALAGPPRELYQWLRSHANFEDQYGA